MPFPHARQTGNMWTQVEQRPPGSWLLIGSPQELHLGFFA